MTQLPEHYIKDAWHNGLCPVIIAVLTPCLIDVPLRVKPVLYFCNLKPMFYLYNLVLSAYAAVNNKTSSFFSNANCPIFYHILTLPKVTQFQHLYIHLYDSSCITFSV